MAKGSTCCNRSRLQSSRCHSKLSVQPVQLAECPIGFECDVPALDAIACSSNSLHASANHTVNLRTPKSIGSILNHTTKRSDP